MPLHLDHLRDSIKALEDVLTVSEDDARMGQLSDIEQIGIRAGVVKHFEITYELSGKLMERWLKTNIGSETASGISRRQMFRLAVEYRLIPDVEQWMRHHEARNTTSHIYDRERAQHVYEVVRGFTHDARRLLKALEAHND